MTADGHAGFIGCLAREEKRPAVSGSRRPEHTLDLRPHPWHLRRSATDHRPAWATCGMMQAAARGQYRRGPPVLSIVR